MISSIIPLDAHIRTTQSRPRPRQPKFMPTMCKQVVLLLLVTVMIISKVEDLIFHVHGIITSRVLPSQVIMEHPRANLEPPSFSRNHGHSRSISLDPDCQQ